MSKLSEFLIGRPVKIVSHASPAHRGKVGEVMALAGGIATVQIKTPRRTEEAFVPLKGLSLIYKPGKAPPTQPSFAKGDDGLGVKTPPRRSFLSVVIPSAVRAAFMDPGR